ncbi:MAG: hypothetical protein WAO00_04785 [Chthoniobacterales bacterium]
MRKRAIILFAVVLAMAVRPLQLPAASCILSNAPSHQACKLKCCANKTCCATSKKDTRPVSQLLSQSVDAKQLVVGFVAVPVIDSLAVAIFIQPASSSVSVRAHSPLPLAASCIRLI